MSHIVSTSMVHKLIEANVRGDVVLYWRGDWQGEERKEIWKYREKYYLMIVFDKLTRLIDESALEISETDLEFYKNS